MTSPAQHATTPFNLLRRFAIGSLVVIAAIAVANALLLSNFLTKRMLDREAHVTMDFVQNILLADRSAGYFAAPSNAGLAARFGNSIAHITTMPDVLRINVYARDATMLWSSDRQLVGRRFERNDELDDALKGELVVHGGRITDEQRAKPEHVGLHPDSEFFIETYIPVHDAGGGPVVGIVEIYKAPVALTAAISAGHRQVWITALLGAAALYLTLFWIVRRADRTIREQRERLVETETMAVVGELASSVVHNIRNPLASIRSSAELAIEMQGENCTEQARDITAAVDRIEGWMRDLLHYARAVSGPRAPVDAAALLKDCFNACALDFDRRGIAGVVAIDSAGTRVSADPALLGHVLHSLVANAIDATPAGGKIEGRLAAAGSGRVAISISDTGSGIAPGQLEQVFRPFYTTKPQGLGLGLPLVRRAVERFGGEIRIASEPGRGTTFTLELPAA
jgi:two-component system sensor histidine kinase HydH